MALVRYTDGMRKQCFRLHCVICLSTWAFALVEKINKVKEEKNMRDRYSMICPGAPLIGVCKMLRGLLGGTRPIKRV